MLQLLSKMSSRILLRLGVYFGAVACVSIAGLGYAVSLQNDCPTCTMALLSFKQDEAAKLPIFSDGRHQLKGGESHTYRVTLDEGQFLYALIEQQGIDVAVTLFNPDGSQIAVSDSPNGRWGSEPVLLIAATSGEYRIGVRSPNAQAEPATYQIRVKALREAIAIDNLRFGVFHSHARKQIRSSRLCHRQLT